MQLLIANHDSWINNMFIILILLKNKPFKSVGKLYFEESKNMVAAGNWTRLSYNTPNNPMLHYTKSLQFWYWHEPKSCGKTFVTKGRAIGSSSNSFGNQML